MRDVLSQRLHDLHPVGSRMSQIMKGVNCESNGEGFDLPKFQRSLQKLRHQPLESAIQNLDAITPRRD